MSVKHQRQTVLAPEFSLLVESCKAAFLGKHPAVVIRANSFDWPKFLRLARFHRVQGLIWKSLSKSAEAVPIAIAEDLARDAASIAASNLRAAVEASRLRAELERRGVSMLLVNGATLGSLAYGDMAVKFSVDIDILIDADRLPATNALLRHQGYKLLEPAGTRSLRELELWHRHRKESTWVNADLHQQVDLHTRLADNRLMIPTIGLRSPRTEVRISGDITLPTLERPELFAYLAVHGASSAWFRMKWISDFGALIGSLQPADIFSLYRKSQDLGAGRAAAQGLLLSDSLFDTLAELPGLRDELRSKKAVRRLHAAALRQLIGNQEPVEPTSTPFGTMRIHWTQFLLQPGAKFKWSELARQVRVMLH